MRDARADAERAPVDLSVGGELRAPSVHGAGTQIPVASTIPAQSRRADQVSVRLGRRRGEVVVDHGREATRSTQWPAWAADYSNLRAPGAGATRVAQRRAREVAAARHAGLAGDPLEALSTVRTGTRRAAGHSRLLSPSASRSALALARRQSVPHVGCCATSCGRAPSRTARGGRRRAAASVRAPRQLAAAVLHACAQLDLVPQLTVQRAEVGRAGATPENDEQEASWSTLTGTCPRWSTRPNGYGAVDRGQDPNY